MSIRGEEAAARARGLVGTRFRPQGRDPRLGLDCVGMAAAATGVPAELLPSDYALRGEHRARIEHELCGLGWQPVRGGRAEPGDVVICEVARAQFHVLLSTGEGFIHADAGLKRVVERPLPYPWPVAGVWRMAGES